MAGNDLTFTIASETRGFEDGVTRGIIDPLEDADDALKDLGRTGDRELAALEQDMVGARRDSERFGDELKDVADALTRVGRKGKDATSDVSQGIRRMDDGVGDFKDEAIQNFSEVASSFNGDITQMADGVQGLTGGLASALTPGIGIPVAILGAAAGAFLANWTNAAEETKEQVADMYRDMVESGESFLSESFVQTAITDLAADTGKWNEALATAESLGLSVQTVLRASVGDQEAINAVIDAANRKRDDEIGKLDELDKSTADYADKVDAVNLKADTTIEKWEAIASRTDSAAAKALAVRSAFESGNAALDAGIRKVQDMAAEIGKVNGATINVAVNPDLSELRRQLGQPFHINVNASGQIDYLQFKGGRQLR